MTKEKWKNLLEGTGVVAIIASLMFVGLQLRQAQDIAESENLVSMLAIRNEVNNSILSNVEIWTKGIAGGDLTDNEAIEFAILLNLVNDSRYFEYIQTRQLSGDETSAPLITDFAIFIFTYPAARDIWLAREEYLIEYRNLIYPDMDDSSDWRDAVMEAVKTLESKRTEVPVKKAAFPDW